MRVAVLGAGTMGQLHASIYKRFSDVEVAAIVGREPAKTQRIAKKIGVNASTNTPQILKDKSIEVVDICLPTHIHKEVVISALESDKHVFCETPIAFNIKDATSMIDKARSRKKIFQVALLMRSVAEVNYVVERVQYGDLGELITVSAHRYHSYKVDDPVIELLTFDFDTLIRLLGLPKKVSAQMVQQKDLSMASLYTILHYEDCSCLVEMHADLPRDLPLSHGLRAVGTDGIIETSTVFTDANSPVPQTSIMFYPKGKEKEAIEIRGYDPYEKECRYFIDTVLGKVSGDLLNAEQALNPLKVAIATKKSLETREEAWV